MSLQCFFRSVAYDASELVERGDVGIGIGQLDARYAVVLGARAHRADGQDRAARVRPRGHLVPPNVRAKRIIDHGFHGELVRVAPAFGEQLAQPRCSLMGVRTHRTEDETVTDPGGAPQRGFGPSAEPQWDVAAYWSGSEAGPVDAVELSVVVDHGLAPQRSEHVNLLLEARAAGLEGCSEAFVLDVVPAGTNREHESSAGEHIHLGRLFGHQHRLALR